MYWAWRGSDFTDRGGHWKEKEEARRRFLERPGENPVRERGF